jgi:hypothetical protein
MLQITEYWNKMGDKKDSNGWFEVLPEHEVKSRFTVNNTLQDLKERYKGRKNFTIEKDRIIEDKGRYYGIHSYVEIVEIKNPKDRVA